MARPRGGKSEVEAISEHFAVGLMVLVVDDDVICLRILEQMLRNCMYNDMLFFNMGFVFNVQTILKYELHGDFTGGIIITSRSAKSICETRQLFQHVTSCSEATVALNLLRERKGCFDVVLSDVHMPDMDGFKLLELVRLEMDLPVIMMSADNSTNIVMRGIDHGACTYLIKPIRNDELENIWQHVLMKTLNESKEHHHSETTSNASLPGSVFPGRFDKNSVAVPTIMQPGQQNPIEPDHVRDASYGPMDPQTELPNGAMGVPVPLHSINPIFMANDDAFFHTLHAPPSDTQLTECPTPAYALNRQDELTIEGRRISNVYSEGSGAQAKECITAIANSMKNDAAKRTERRKGRPRLHLRLEDLKPQFGKKLKDVAEALGVSRSTIKRACRYHGILRWPCNEQQKKNPSLFEAETANEIAPDYQQNMRPSTSSNLLVSQTQSKSIQHLTDQAEAEKMMIKVNYEDDTIKFRLHLSSGMNKLLEEVAMRLNLEIGRFKLKYFDEVDDQILLACDTDLLLCLETVTAMGKACIQLFVQLN